MLREAREDLGELAALRGGNVLEPQGTQRQSHDRKQLVGNAEKRPEAVHPAQGIDNALIQEIAPAGVA